jgi:serine/threonine protein kinase/tetratricopeptide (TPR) repeat protein
MSTARHQQIKDIFHRVVAVPVDERLAFLDRVCAGDAALRAEVLSLLAHDDVAGDAFADDRIGAMRAALVDVAQTPGDVTDDAQRGESAPATTVHRVGQYEVVRLLGRGGMGMVYEARQQNPKRTVAVKVIRPGLTTRQLLRRFEHEAHILGKLKHPGIAHIYEAGVANVVTTDGSRSQQPFLAMELIRGQTLDAHLRAADLPMRDRLALLAEVCDAVEHAHAAGIVHRDLKPGNILIDTDGQPKVLDFGVARLTDSDVQLTTLQTDVGQLIGTLPYMSPEQIAAGPAPPDARSDVYALGVILHEVLGGRLPYELPVGALPQAARIIQETEPGRLSSINSDFRGDIETIVAKALEKDPDRRYPSAGALANDLRHYLADHPITARPPSKLYQFRKFSRRNRAAVIGVVAVFVVLCAGIAATSMGMVQARRAEALARTRLAQAEVARKEADAVNTFLNDMLRRADPARNDGNDMTVREALDEAAARINDFADSTPAVRAAIHRTIGVTYQRMGQYQDGARHLRQALAIFAKLPDADPRARLEYQVELADCLFRAELLDETEPLLRDGIAQLRQLDPPDHEMLARQLHVMGKLHKRRSELPAAIACQREAVELHRRRGPLAPGLAGALTELGALLSREGRYQDAEQALREAIDIYTEVYGATSAYTGGIQATLAVALKRQGRKAEAEAVCREALAIQRGTHGDDHPATLTTMVNLGGLLADQQKFEEAEALFREAIPAMRKRHGDDSFHVGVAYGKLAEAQRAQDRWAEAETSARQALRVFRGAMGAHPFTARVLTTLGELRLQQDDPQQAIGCFAEAATMYRDGLGEDHPVYAMTLVQHARALRAGQDHESADTVFTAAENLLKTAYANVSADDRNATAQRIDYARKLAELYGHWEKYKDHETWHKRQAQLRNPKP